LFEHTPCFDYRQVTHTLLENRPITVHHLMTQQKLHRESKKGATLTMAITVSILDRFAKFFHRCKQQ